MVIANRQFRDEEYATPRRIFEEEGAVVTVASSSLRPARGMLGMSVTPDILLTTASAAQFDGVVFVGGMGATEYWNNPVAHRLAQQSLAQGKVTAAVCLAPAILANAGLLRAKRATIWPSEIEQLKTHGAFYTGKQVEQDGLLITGNGPEAAEQFARAILETLSKKPRT